MILYIYLIFSKIGMKIRNLLNYLKTRQPVTRMLYLCLFVSLVTLVVYFLEIDYNDKTLSVLLGILKYSSFLLCGFSLYKLIINVYHTVRGPSVSRVIKILIYLAFIIYSMIVIFFETFISVIAGGNG